MKYIHIEQNPHGIGSTCIGINGDWGPRYCMLNDNNTFMLFISLFKLLEGDKNLNHRFKLIEIISKKTGKQYKN